MTTNNTQFTYENFLPVVGRDELLRNGYRTTTCFHLIDSGLPPAHGIVRMIFGLWIGYQGLPPMPSEDANDLVYDPETWEKS